MLAGSAITCQSLQMRKVRTRSSIVLCSKKPILLCEKRESSRIRERRVCPQDERGAFMYWILARKPVEVFPKGSLWIYNELDSAVNICHATAKTVSRNTIYTDLHAAVCSEAFAATTGTQIPPSRGRNIPFPVFRSIKGGIHDSNPNPNCPEIGNRLGANQFCGFLYH